MNFNVNFNVLLSKYIVHQLVEIKKTLIITRCTVQLRKKTFSLFAFTPRKIFIAVLSDITEVSLNNEILINEFVI